MGFAGVYIFLDDISLIPIEVAPLRDKIPIVTLPTDTSSIPPRAKQIPQEGQSNISPDFEKRSVMPTISFEHNSSELNPFFQKALSDLVPSLLNGYCVVTISGHTDDIGSDRTNQKLARVRAQVVADFLI